MQASKLLFHIFVNICGPFIYNYGQFLYFMLLIDDHSCYTFIYFLKHCNDALTYFKEYKVAVKKYLGEFIIILCIDNVPEFIEGEF
jgi:hypothetical protein